MLAYTSIVRPKLEYACIIWDPYTKTNIHALEMIQHKAVRFVYSKYRSSDSPTQLMRDHNIPTLELRRKIQRLKFLYLLKNNKLSMRPEQYIQPLTARRTRHRHADSLTPFNARTNIFKFSFFPRTVTEWNQLPALFINIGLNWTYCILTCIVKVLNVFLIHCLSYVLILRAFHVLDLLLSLLRAL